MTLRTLAKALAGIFLAVSLAACGGGEAYPEDDPNWQPAPSEQTEENGLSASQEEMMWDKRMELCAIYTDSLSKGMSTLTDQQFYNTTQAIEALGCFTS